MLKGLLLHENMRRLAEQVPERADALIEKADALEASVKRAYADDGTKDDVKRMLGCWARARGLWSEVTGEPLV